ncbi:MAG: hypothetical protein J6Z43_03860 [Clostridiales bacterium]|nr:hypothetical protein [Clostridiales bacterium]
MSYLENGKEIYLSDTCKDNSLREELEGQEKDSSSLLEFRYIYGLEEIV